MQERTIDELKSGVNALCCSETSTPTGPIPSSHRLVGTCRDGSVWSCPSLDDGGNSTDKEKQRVVAMRSRTVVQRLMPLYGSGLDDGQTTRRADARLEFVAPHLLPCHRCRALDKIAIRHRIRITEALIRRNQPTRTGSNTKNMVKFNPIRTRSFKPPCVRSYAGQIDCQSSPA